MCAMMTAKAAFALALAVSVALGFGLGWVAYGLRHSVTNRD